MAGGYRGELDALRARKEALEAEVEGLRETEEELVEKEALVYEQRLKIKRLEAKLGQLEEELEEEREEEERDEEERDEEERDEEERDEAEAAATPGSSVAALDQPVRVASTPNAARLALVLAFGAAGVVVLALSWPGLPDADPSSEQVPAPTPRRLPNGHRACLLTTVPSGAMVYGDTAYIANKGTKGLDPMGMRDRYVLGLAPVDLAQIAGYTVDVELTGYEPKKVRIPGLSVRDVDGPCEVIVELSPKPEAAP